MHCWGVLTSFSDDYLRIYSITLCYNWIALINWASLDMSRSSKSLRFRNLVCYFMATVLYLKILKSPSISDSSSPYFSSLEYLDLIFMFKTADKCLAPKKYLP